MNETKLAHFSTSFFILLISASVSACAHQDSNLPFQPSHSVKSSVPVLQYDDGGHNVMYSETEQLPHLIRQKRSIVLRRVIIKNRLGPGTPPVYVHCQDEKKWILSAESNLTNGQRMAFTVYDTAQRIVICEVEYLGQHYDFKSLNGKTPLPGNIFLLLKNGIFLVLPRKKERVQILLWKSSSSTTLPTNA